MIKTDIRKNDNVAVIAGRDKGKRGHLQVSTRCEVVEECPANLGALHR